jgi:hypothetical protein
MMKFPIAIAIRRNANDKLMSVNCRIDASHDGGNRIVSDVNIAATAIVTTNGTEISMRSLRDYSFGSSVAGMVALR